LILMRACNSFTETEVGSMCIMRPNFSKVTGPATNTVVEIKMQISVLGKPVMPFSCIHDQTHTSTNTRINQKAEEYLIEHEPLGRQ